MQSLVKSVINSVYGVQIRKYVNDSYYCKSEQWMKTEIDENFLDFWKFPNEIYIVRLKKDDGLDDDCDFQKFYLVI